MNEIELLLSKLATVEDECSRVKAALDRERAEKDDVLRENRSLANKVGFLQALIEKLKRGNRSEKVNPDQLELFEAIDPMITAMAEEASDDEAVVTVPQHQRKKRASGRGPLPANLERKEIVYDVSDAERTCGLCGDQAMELIDAETTEELEYQPERFFVTAHKRLKYACPCCKRNVVTAPLPARVIPKGIPGPGLVAHVVTAKYADHLPLHRQEGIIARSGVVISRQTMCDWVAVAADLLSPIVEELRRELLRGCCVRMDATGVKMLAKTRTVRAHLWAYLKKNEIAVYDFTVEHNKEGPRRFLGDHRGYVQGDADTIYDPLFKSATHLVEVGCMAHCRRKFFDACDTDRDRGRHAIALFREIYAIEAEMKAGGLSPGQRTIARRELTKPLLAAFHAWISEEQARVLPQSPIGRAVRYALKHWTALTRFADDGELEIDNNDTERALRHVAVGRKNWLFAGNAEGGRRAAVIYSAVMTCKLNGIDPFAYLRDVLAERARNPQRNVAEFTPMAWKVAQAAAAASKSSEAAQATAAEPSALA
jgi:transposase